MSLDEVEYAKLVEAIGLAEKAFGERSIGVANTPSGDASPEFLRSAKLRISELEEHGEISGIADRDEKKRALNEALVLYVAVNEPQLSATEKQVYTGFLGKDFFTKSDFEELEEFYGSAWERLSDDGKAQMSHRIWEGVRRGEYEFVELPEQVRRKEADLLYQQLAAKQLPPNLEAIPQKDREEFIASYKAGNHAKMDEVLNRESFKENVSVEKPTSRIPDTKAVSSDHGQEIDSFDLSNVKKPSELARESEEASVTR